jgi:hypothetical protein
MSILRVSDGAMLRSANHVVLEPRMPDSLWLPWLQFQPIQHIKRGRVIN